MDHAIGNGWRRCSFHAKRLIPQLFRDILPMSVRFANGDSYSNPQLESLKTGGPRQASKKTQHGGFDASRGCRQEQPNEVEPAMSWKEVEHATSIGMHGVSIDIEEMGDAMRSLWNVCLTDVIHRVSRCWKARMDQRHTRGGQDAIMLFRFVLNLESPLDGIFPR